ncbi:MAG: DUF2182 domain-containing protein, partial [Longimicrobiales bacterium]
PLRGDVAPRERALLTAGVVVASLAAWVWLVREAATMSGMAHMAMPDLRVWSLAELGALVVMWAVMMTAMMLPSATPTILLFASVQRARRARRNVAVPAAIFVGGYLLVWTGYASLAALAQWTLHAAAMLSPAMAATSPVLGGVILLAAGLYQWSPVKQVCLSRCHSPFGFVAREWREGARGALVMGMRHGSFCVGCCALLMTLLFVAGVMNLLWVAALAVLVLAEKTLPGGRWIARGAGLLLTGAGIWLLAGAGP